MSGIIRSSIAFTVANFAPGNAGLIFYADIPVPLFGLVLLWLARPTAHARRPAVPVSALSAAPR